MKRIRIDEVTVSREPGVVPVFDMRATCVVASGVGAHAFASGFVVASVRQMFLPDESVAGDPHADIALITADGVLLRVWIPMNGPGAALLACGG